MSPVVQQAPRYNLFGGDVFTNHEADHHQGWHPPAAGG